MTTDCDVIIIGAGPAGLQTARQLAAAGKDVIVLEKNPTIGGRLQTRLIDGFVVDKGFQAFNTSYPKVAEALDLKVLDVHYLQSGCLVRHQRDRSRGPANHLARLSNLLRYPQRFASFIMAGVFDRQSVGQVVRWLEPLQKTMNPYPFPSGNPDDETLGRSLDRAGIDGTARAFLEQSFLCMFADPEFKTSAEFGRIMMWCYIGGKMALPARGIASIPEYLAGVATGKGARIRVNAPVVKVNPDETHPSVELADGTTLSGRVVVVATDPVDSAELVGENGRQMTGFTTWWFATDERPSYQAVPGLDFTGCGPLAYTLIVSNVNPSSAPPGKHLIAATAPLRPGKAVDDATARRHAGYIWGVDTTEWQLLQRDDVERAYTLQTPGLPVIAPRVVDGVVTSGEWRHSASLNGAFAAAESTAIAVMNHLR